MTGNGVKRVLLLTSHPLEGHDGADKELALALASGSDQIAYTWFGQAWPGAQPAIAAGTRWPVVSRRSTPGLVERAQIAARTLAVSNTFDVVHAVFSIGRLSGLYARARDVVGGRMDAPVVHTVPGIVNPDRLRPHHVLGTPVALSNYTAGLLRASGKDDVRIIPPGIDLDRWRSTPRAEGERPKILSVGHWGSGDGLEQALMVAEALQERSVECSWVFAIRDRPGQNEAGLRRRLSARAHDRGVTDIACVGRVKDMRALVASCSLVLFNPTTHFASSDVPLTVLESMAACRPVVVSDLLALDELGDAVARAPVGDIAGTAAAAERLLTSRSAWDEAAARGRSHVEAHFGSALMVQRYRDLYAEILN